MDKGVYCLLLECTTALDLRIGALGVRRFVPGWYLYVGSALGSGGLSRVSRYIRFSREQYRPPKWHIDYLMAAVSLRAVVCAKTETDLECVLASAIGGTGVPAFGCSNCDCATHLLYRLKMPETEIIAAFAAIELSPLLHHLA